MQLKTLTRTILVSLSISAAANASAAEFGFFDPRSAAMGNTGVASGTLLNGGFHNPALLAAQNEDDDFGLLLPAVGVHVADPNDLLDDIDRFQFSEQNGDTAGMQSALVESSGKAITANGNGGIAMNFAGDRYSGGLLVNAYTLNSVRVLPDLVTPLNSELETLGLQVVEIGIPLAMKFDVAGQSFAVGITPKYAEVTTNEVVEPLAVADTSIDNLADNPGDQTEEGGLNADVGVIWGVGNGWRAGIVGRNLIARDYQTASGRIVSLKPQFRAGVAYTNDWVTLAVDGDLNENDPVGFESPSQMVGIGAELDVFDILRLRAGYMHNVKADETVDKPGVATAGLGINIFGLHVDAAAMTNGNGNDLGAYLQLGVKF